MTETALQFAYLALSCAVLVVASDGIFAQSYPAKPIRIIVPVPPGGSNDIRVRIIADKLTQSLGKQVMVENRPGADGPVHGPGAGALGQGHSRRRRKGGLMKFRTC